MCGGLTGLKHETLGCDGEGKGVGWYAEQQYKLFTVYFQNRSLSSTFNYTVDTVLVCRGV